ncbi:MAG: acetylornithine transaminase [Pelagibacteraceae bacterium]|nr:acetylornithine transaminase [Pelagibacteraceae bacterium]OUV88718.1 MAG: acetylornithine transaminase [Pelagibacteraceae bacterium TMED146]|tara:strand:- start:128 stop:1294 length:1167 start_codon:yes stop_codon:yes gene_type:complete
MSAILGTYARRPVSFSHGKGCYLFSASNDKYLDFVSGIAVNALGHCHDHLVKTVQEQAAKLWHVSNAFEIPEQEKLAQRLVENTFADYVIFMNSGAEATEASIKIARKYFFEKGQPEKNRIITFKGAFHGRTLASLFAANNPDHIKGFEPKVEGFDQVDFGDHEALKKAINKNTAAIMVETILGEGGIKIIPDQCLQGLRKLCDEHDLLLILDEVQCGIGRSGKFFAFDWAGIEPDIVPIAKGIGGGFPVGACLVNKKAGSGMKPGNHGSTFGGNPLAMSVGNAVLDIILEKGFLENVVKIGKYFEAQLLKLIEKYPSVIEEVRGKGLLRGIKLKLDNAKFLNELFEHKMLAVKASENVVRLLPPLIVKEKEIDEAISIIEKVCEKLK